MIKFVINNSKVKMHQLSDKERENALNEVRILASIQHENIIGYKEAFFDEASNCLCIIMENADGGDISNKIKSIIQLIFRSLRYEKIDSRV